MTKRPRTTAEQIERLEEERRLAHVAVTRAQKRLVLTYVRNYSGSDNFEGTVATRSTLPLPQPILREGSPNAAMWLRVMPQMDYEHS